ncbi:hypothetical protein ES703_45879 [subsurface metagenome]
MRYLTVGKEKLIMPGKTVGEVISLLDEAYPGIEKRLCEGGRLDPAVTVSVDGKVTRLGLLEAIGEQSEIHFLPAVAGG